MAELHLSAETREDADRAVRGIEKSTEPGRPGLWRDIRSVLVGVDFVSSLARAVCTESRPS